jgi:hypothetical protein
MGVQPQREAQQIKRVIHDKKRDYEALYYKFQSDRSSDFQQKAGVNFSDNGNNGL